MFHCDPGRRTRPHSSEQPAAEDGDIYCQTDRPPLAPHQSQVKRSCRPVGAPVFWLRRYRRCRRAQGRGVCRRCRPDTSHRVARRTERRGGRRAFVVTDAPFLADPTGVRDSTQAFIDALAAVSTNGGGTALAPAGIYRIDGTLAVPGGTTLRGADLPHRAAPDRIGTLPAASFGQGNETAASFISLGRLSCVRDLAICIRHRDSRATRSGHTRSRSRSTTP